MRRMGVADFEIMLKGEPIGTMWTTSTECVIKTDTDEWFVMDSSQTTVPTVKVAMACYVRSNAENPRASDKVWSLS